MSDEPGTALTAQQHAPVEPAADATTEPDSDLPADTDPPADTDVVTTADPGAGPAPAAPRGSGLLAVLALAWLAAMLWSAYAAISSAHLAEMAITSIAYALPGAVSASLVAGASVALAAVGMLTRRGRAGTPTARFGAATGAGLVVGLLGALVVVFTYGDGSTVTVVAGTVAAAATIGGAVGGVRASGVVAATVAAALAVFAAGFVLNLFQEPVLRLYGSGDDEASQVSALGWFAMTASLTGGLAAGLVAYAVLRRAHRRAGEVTPRWPLYALAGAGPGLLLVAAEVLARTAGARVLALAGSLSEVERAAQSLLSGSRVNNALIVTFVGAVVAIVAVGRTMRPADDD